MATVTINLIKSAFSNHYIFKIRLENTIADVTSYLTAVEDGVTRFLFIALQRSRLQFKATFTLKCTYYHPVLEESMDKSHESDIKTMYSEFDVASAFKHSAAEIKNEETEFLAKKSGSYQNRIQIALDPVIYRIQIFL